MVKSILDKTVRICCYSLLGLVLMVVFAGRASASPTPTCSTTEYCAAQASNTAPGTFIGTVGTGTDDFNQIGDFTVYNNSATAKCCVVTSADTPSYYEFYWAGGGLEIQGAVGNNGTSGSIIDMELDSDGSTETGGTATLVSGASLAFPASGAPEINQTLYDAYLAPGYYSIDTYVAPNPSDNIDPTYRVQFTPNDDVAPAPEPSSIAMLGIGLFALLGLAGFAKRRSTGLSAA
jgi:hypothetical protein